jgi:hypothetical protein
MTAPSPPRDLGPRGRALWRKAVDEFTFNAVERELLRQLATTVDEIAALEKALTQQGPTVKGSRGQPVLNPIYSQLVSHRKLADQLSAALPLPVQDEVVGRRRSAQAKQAVQTRWRKTKSGGRVNRIAQQQQGGSDGTP